jgi:hypothetical protein
MDDPRSVIERSLSRVGSESYTLESFYRRRDRKRARQRLTAGIVGLTIAIVIAAAGAAILRSAPDHLPADTRRTPILRDGEVLQVVDPFRPTATLVATDPATGHQRTCMAAAVVVDGSKSSPSRPIEAGSRGKSRASTVATRPRPRLDCGWPAGTDPRSP